MVMLLRSRNLFILLLLATSTAGLAWQWRSIETEHYRLQVPHAWTIVKGEQFPGPDYSFDLTGSMIPAMHNKQEASARGFIGRTGGASLEEAITLVRRQNRGNSDKRFDSDSDQVTYIKLKSGEDAAIIKMRWLLMSRNIHQTRYDLVIFSDKLSTAYTVALYFAYFDRKYSIEQIHKLDERTREIYETFEWR